VSVKLPYVHLLNENIKSGKIKRCPLLKLLFLIIKYYIKEGLPIIESIIFSIIILVLYIRFRLINDSVILS
jgi:hypothetical protein